MTFTLLRGRGRHTGQGRKGTSLNVRDGRKEGAKLGSLPAEKGRVKRDEITENSSVAWLQ